MPILKDHQAGGLRMVILSGHKNRVGVLRPGKDPAGQRAWSEQLALRHAFHRQRIGTQLVKRVLILATQAAGQEKERRNTRDQFFHYPASSKDGWLPP